MDTHIDDFIPDQGRETGESEQDTNNDEVHNAGKSASDVDKYNGYISNKAHSAGKASYLDGENTPTNHMVIPSAKTKNYVMDIEAVNNGCSADNNTSLSEVTARDGKSAFGNVYSPR